MSIEKNRVLRHETGMPAEGLYLINVRWAWEVELSLFLEPCLYRINAIANGRGVAFRVVRKKVANRVGGNCGGAAG